MNDKLLETQILGSLADAMPPMFRREGETFVQDALWQWRDDVRSVLGWLDTFPEDRYDLTMMRYGDQYPLFKGVALWWL